MLGGEEVTVSDKVCLLMSDQGCGVFPLQDIKLDLLLFDLGFDSLRYMELVVMLEESFNIEFPDEMLEITSQTAVKEIVMVVEKSLKK